MSGGRLTAWRPGLLVVAGVTLLMPTVGAAVPARADTVTATVQAGLFPDEVGVDPVTNKIYVANSESFVTVIDGTTNASTPASAPNGVAVAVNPVTNKIYFPEGKCSKVPSREVARKGHPSVGGFFGRFQREERCHRRAVTRAHHLILTQALTVRNAE
jgi:YVTN family beta-propeller protein